MTNQREICGQILLQGRRQFSGEIEVYISTHSSLEISVLDDGIEDVCSHNESGIGVRVLSDQKVGFAYVSELSVLAGMDCLSQAIRQARFTASDLNYAFAPNQAMPEKVDGFDQEIASTPLANKIELARLTEKAARMADRRVLKTEKVTYAEAAEEVWLQNTLGFSGNYRSNHCGVSAQVMAGENQEFENGYGFDYSKKISKINPEKAGKEAATQALGLLNARPTSSRKTTIILEPRVAAQIVGILLSPLSGEAVIKGKSLFSDRLGTKIASPNFSLVDDGTLAEGLASQPFDGEGTKCQRTVLIREGYLQSFLHSIYSGNKLNQKPTGNGLRGSYHALPSLSATNLFIENGSDDPTKLLRRLADGIYVSRLMGVHTANPISGDFSFGIQGHQIENGEITSPVRGITVAGNLVDLLMAVAAIGNDLRFTPVVGSPTLVVEGLSVGGH